MSAGSGGTPVSTTTRLSDDLTGPELDGAAWHFLEYPMGDDAPAWVCREPGANVVVDDGTCSVEIKRFELTHAVQPIDNCKFVALSRAVFAVPETGTVTVSARLTANSIGASGDYRDGFAALVVLDPTTGLVFDIAGTGTQLLAIHELLPMGHGAPFTRVVDAPLAGIEAGPDVPHHCAITLDRAAAFAAWDVDGTRVFDAHAVEIPAAFVVGMGVFTLRPTHGAAGASISGQGLHATWADLRVDFEPTDLPSPSTDLGEHDEHNG